MNENINVVKTDGDAKDGQNKCPKCGATDITLNMITGKLRCNFCRYEFDPVKFDGLSNDISNLQGSIIGSGASDVVSESNDVITLKCTSCGAEVVIDTSCATSARCHWCRNVLSINSQIPNGAVPDALLPFKITKEEAQSQIQSFVGKRKFYAHPKFKAEFTTDNIMGVYFPYMIVDSNCHVKLSGKGEHTIRRYTRRQGDREVTYYDADLYSVKREFDLGISGLTIESNSDRLNNQSTVKTNNVINAIMPFDVENCVKYDANYLRGYTSEKRDTNVEQLKDLVGTQSKDIARFAANDTLKHYDRGVSWTEEDLEVKGQQWKAAYLPVWLYSYQQPNNKKLHYVAVNARTKETMGSVPIHMPKLFAVSFVVELFGIIAMFFVDWDYSWIFLLLGIIYFALMFIRYRNSNARHMHEAETAKKVSNLVSSDDYITRRNGITNPRIEGANNKRVNGQTNGSNILDTFTDDPVVSIINDAINKKD